MVTLRWARLLLIMVSSAWAISPAWTLWPASAKDLPEDGLILHLDAGATDKAGNTTPGPLPRWMDLSESRRDFVQDNAMLQPQRLWIDGQAIVRFDGQQDYMRALGQAESIDNMTLFMVAAPHENLGDFRGLIATNALGKRDYESGFNLDLGPGPTRRLDYLNIEGVGFGGARDLYSEDQPFGTLHVFESVMDSARMEVQLWVDGKSQGHRARVPAPIAIDQWTLGARYYTNGPGDHLVRGPLKGDFAEVLVWNRILTDEERQQVRDHLVTKYEKLAVALPRQLKLDEPGIEWERIENPPLVQMLMPGFTVQEIPVELTNVNNVRFRKDGRLVTLGYNGDIHLLDDTDGDGIEDHKTLFWKNEGSLRGPLGMVLTKDDMVLTKDDVTKKDSASGMAVIVPSKGKVSMVRDRDNDDIADEEVVIADGWQEISQNVDAVGIAMDKEGAIYFGLGTANYANGYLIDEQGKAAYDLQSDRGTVQRISPDFKSRETVCTGVRFPVAMAFNREGDLFCTDQEGATWLPNGNPLDELLHITPGKHYGFPPRHPRHNPNVIDEPSVFDFGPQHQSTCGMFFNDAPEGSPIFGPEAWRGNAITCGESRGKLWRTELVKTTHGYVAATQLIACLQMLTVDACLAPDGDLVVACHSGPPDWGTGPTGIGKLFRISWNGQEQVPGPDAELNSHASQPPVAVSAWAANPHEVRIALDRPMDAEWLAEISQEAKIQFGESVRAGDEYENLVPPYAVVQRQAMQMRRALQVHGVNVTTDLRTIVLNTDVMQQDLHYAVRLRRLGIDYSLRGVQAEWTPTDNNLPTLAIVLPHVDLAIAEKLTKGSAEHEVFFQALRQGEGTLVLTTQVNLKDILRPAIQAGAEIDYQWPKEVVAFRIEGADRVAVDEHQASVQRMVDDEGRDVFVVSPTSEQVTSEQVTSDAGKWVSVQIDLFIGKHTPRRLFASVSTNEDSTARPLALHRFALPWMSPAASGSDADTEVRQIVEIEGGDWGRGRRVFHSEAAGCFKCHAMEGDGGRIGPDLSNLRSRDYQSVIRDIMQPSYSINPDYVGYTLSMEDGRILTGVLRSKAGQMVLGDAKGEEMLVNRDLIESEKPAGVSIMPMGTLDKLSEEQRKDLMTFLLTAPPHMPLDSPLQAPPMRTSAEVAEMLVGAEMQPAIQRKLKLTLVAGQKDHGPGEHDYPAWLIQWGQLLAAASETEVSVAWEFPSAQQCAEADVLIFFQKGTWNDDRQEQMDQFFARGGGAVYVHWAVNGDERVGDFSKRIGLASHGGNIRYRHGPLRLMIHNTDHPIVRNFDSIDLYDESYWLLTGEREQVTLLGTSLEEGEATPQMWAHEQAAGRVFVSIPGHYSWTFDDPLFRILLLRGIAWSAKESVDRFNELVPLGARMSK
jgi:putative heme-binding domain-containing protein